MTGLSPLPAESAVTLNSLTMLGKLRSAGEVRTGYDRDLFNHWIDADGDGCNTREEVLIAEAIAKPVPGSGCSITTGRWLSQYDGVSVTSARSLDIDHLVPLAEAWDSGARFWNSKQRQAYANDLGDPRALIAVTASTNRSKSDQDPAEWLPARGKCGYVSSWIAVKYRWNLSVDTAERAKLKSVLRGCKAINLKVTRITGLPTSGAGGGGGTVPNPTGSGNVYYANCDAVRAAGKAPLLRGQPGYRAGLDRDGDGRACE